VGQGGQVLQRGVGVCPGEWDRVGRCHSEESESVQVKGGQLLQQGVRVCPGERDRVGRCYSEESESVQRT
jgi:hypothetical protein